MKPMLRLFWRLADVRPIDLVVPAVLVLVASAFEGLSFGLLIPLTRAIADGGFGFLSESPAFGWLIRLAPGTGAPSDGTLVVVILLLIVLGRFGFLATSYARDLWVAARTERYRVRMADATFRRVLSFGRLYFSKRSLGELDAEIGWASSAPELLKLVEFMFERTIRLIVKLGVMVVLSPALTLTFFLTMPVALLIMGKVQRYAESVADKTADVERRMRREVLDLLSSIPLVKAFSQEERAAKTHAEILAHAQGLAVRRARVVGLRWPISEFVFLTAMLIVQGSVIALSGSFTPGDLGRFAAFLLLLQQSFPDANALSSFSLSLAEQLPKLKPAAQLFADGDKHTVTSGQLEFQGLRDGIAVRGLSFEYTAGIPVLHEVDAEIPAGRVTAIVGESGSGKTTFVDLIARLYECAPGTILLDGQDAHAFSLPSLHSRMALVSQENWLLNRSLRDNVRFGLEEEVDDATIVGLLEDLALGDLLARLPDGLATEVGDRGVRLSGGQRQRIDIARTILRRPDIVILDEATSALDSIVERRVLATVKQRLAASTVLVIAHRLSTVRSADFILVMSGGQIVERGAWSELLQREGTFYELHRAQHGSTASATS